MADLRLHRVVKRFEHVEVIHGVDLEVEHGEFVVFVGPSGCGKSTLLNLMGLLDRPTGGAVHIDGKKIESYKDKELAKLRNEKIGFVFQEYHLINDLSVVDNVEIPQSAFLAALKMSDN